MISPLAFQCDSSVDPEPVTNWSGTHSTNLRVHYPTTTAEVEGLVAEANKNRKKLRPMGSHLSPNGLSFADPNESVISLSLLDNILKIDTSKSTVTCQSGCRVSSVVDALRPHGLTLPQLASIAEQQIGGFISVAAHGTGHKIPTVDDFVDSFTVVTPALGTLTFSRSDVGMNKRMFDLILVGLGLFGVITEVTISCITAHNLLEHTFTLTREAAVQRLPQLLATHKYVRYMWIPYTDTVVVVTNDPFDASASTLPTKMQTVPDVRDKLRPFTEMLLAHPGNGLSEEEVAGLGMGEVRDALLALGPLDVAHVKRVNAVEAEFWKHATGYQYKPSDQLLQFDCGGSQWVQENCFKVTDGEDMRFMTKLLVEIEARNIPAPSPIEQRWSAGSRSRMSPAAGAAGDVFSWVGIIMYEGVARERSELYPYSPCIHSRLVIPLFTPVFAGICRRTTARRGQTSRLGSRARTGRCLRS